MSEEQTDAKDDFELQAEKVFAEVEKETPSDSSTETKPEETTETTETSGTEPAKTEQVKEVESDESLSVDEKMDKIKEILGDDQEAIDAYVKEKGYHTDPAWVKQREIIDKLKKGSEAQSTLADEDRTALAEFKEFRSSPEYIQQSMKAQGYTQEAIDKELQESGFEVEAKAEDDVQLVINKLGIKVDDMTPEAKASVTANIEDVVKIADILLQDRLGKTFKKELAPVKEHISSIQQSEGATKLMNMIKDTVKTEAILDYGKDVEPALNKFLDDNSDATQQDVLEHFKSINHTLTVERLKTGKRKEERDDKRGENRQNISGVKSPSGLPEKSGDFDQDADAFLDAAGIN